MTSTLLTTPTTSRRSAGGSGQPQVDSVASALADATRRSILTIVRDRDVPAGEIAGSFPTISRPAVSQHLRVLHDAGLVTVHVDGRQRRYRARPEGFGDLASYVEQFWSTRLAALQRAAERAEHGASR